MVCIIKDGGAGGSKRGARQKDAMGGGGNMAFKSDMYHCTVALLAYLSFERDYFPVHGAEHLNALCTRSHGSKIIVIDVHATRRASLVPSAQWGSTLRRATSGPQRARAPEYNTNQQTRS